MCLYVLDSNNFILQQHFLQRVGGNVPEQKSFSYNYEASYEAKIGLGKSQNYNNFRSTTIRFC